MANNYVDQNSSDGDFYKGLFYGLILGAGLAWFLGTKEGKKIKERFEEKGEEFIDKAKESIDQTLQENFVEDEDLPGENQSEKPPPRYFEGK